jgi:triosephosphate isomerase (TIM)
VTLALPVIAGNWKLNHTPAETLAYFRSFAAELPPGHSGTVIIFPTALCITTAHEALRGRSDIHLGVQNVHSEATGAFTGEISATLSREAGAAFALAGHSERRHLFGETDEQTRLKVRSILDAGLVPVLCVGETLEEREGNRAKAIVQRQLDAVMGDMESSELSRLLVAYEPVWAIGTGRTASPSDASEMHLHIRSLLQDRFGAAGEAVPILYGGSVKPENAADLLAAPGVDGLLVGGASLDPVGFARIASLG